MIDESQWQDLSDKEFQTQVLKPVFEEAKRRLFTIQMNPFDYWLHPRTGTPRSPLSCGPRNWVCSISR